ncbi:MAG: hypothetical protein JJLCMIEE_03211 [Acidimicrobiales bacterium]|nr:MAG: dimethyladenosine transferase [Actinomycetota bacterium]MBV6510091.1 hypothetical protein [Acidimicrobiales bacterium]RIK03585.1 MAG: dimethyladenosine transferase [Acidobacteriota bacterium]
MAEQTASKDRQVSVSRVIAARPEAIFGVLRDPAMHSAMDGSGTVRGNRKTDAAKLELGSRFRMDMKIGIPYRITSKVVEYDENRLIAWAHLGRHRWRYRLEPVEGGTEVTETFDWSTSISPRYIELMRYPEKHPESMERTLERLDEIVTSGSA